MPGLRRAGAFSRLLLSLLPLAASEISHAACLKSPDPAVRELQTLAMADPNAALARAEERLRAAPAAGSPARDLAWLHAVRARAYSALELDAEARAAAEQGMKLVPDERDPVNLALFLVKAENVYGAQGIAEATRQAQTSLDAGIAGPEGKRCTLITLGTLQSRDNRADLAVVTLTQAYRDSDAAGDREQRMRAATQLSKVMRELGDYRQALALNSEVIEWNIAHGETLMLSVTRYLRGVILLEMHEYPAALLAFANARALSVAIGDQQGVAFADMRICQVLVDLRKLREARESCERALAKFSASSSVDVIKQTRSLLGQIDLAEGRADRALVIFDEILANDAADMPPREVMPLFKLRSNAHAALGNRAAAYADLSEYTRRYTETTETRRVRQAIGMRARFEIDRELDRNAALQRELLESRQRQQELQRRTWLAVTAGALVITLLTVLLYGARSHRRQLAALANHDVLTGLPNRRHTAQLASAELERAARNGEPLTLALVDLDHFKVINDRCGHAGGDQVLREFARLSRDALRATDIIGRWGGEEFLLVMPNAPLDTALGVVERLRTLARTISAPGSGDPIAVSLSAGLASCEANVNSLDALVARADIALYRAKHEGRNRVRIDGAEADEGGAPFAARG